MAVARVVAVKMMIRRFWALALGLASLALAEPQLGEVRNLGDHLEVNIQLEQPAEVEISSSTCLARIVAQDDKVVTISLLPRGFNACTVDLKIGDEIRRLSVNNPGEAGFNVILGGSGQYGPSGATNYGGTLGISGGVGDFHLNGQLGLGSATALDGRLRFRYQATQLDWADNSGIAGHPAGSTGPGVYAAQELWMLTLAGAFPLSAPARVGLGLNTSNLCFGGNVNILIKDPILWLGTGLEGFSLRVQYQPKRSYFLDYEGDYSAIPDLNFHFGGSEVSGYLEARGIVTDPALDWLKWQVKGTYDLSGPLAIGSDGSFDTPDAHLGYSYSPSSGTLVAGNYRWGIGQNLTELKLAGQYASAGPSFGDLGSSWVWDENWGSVLGFRYGTLGFGGRVGMSYLDDLAGVFKTSVGLEADNFALSNSYRASLALDLKGLEGWALSAEVTRSFGSSGDTTAKISAKEWFFVPADPPPTATAQWADPKETPAQPEANYCWRWR